MTKLLASARALRAMLFALPARLLHPEQPRLDPHLVAMLGSPGVFGRPEGVKSRYGRGPFALLARLRGRDFARITTPDRAQLLARQGKLARVLLIPVVLGGVDAEANAAYVPREVIPVHQRLTQTLERYLREGRIDKFTIAPEFHGRSLVPARIRVEAAKEGRVGAFTTVIGIW